VVQVHPGPPFAFSRLPSVVPQIPTHNWAHTSLHHLRSHSQRGKIFPLRRPCFIAVVLRISVVMAIRLFTSNLNGRESTFKPIRPCANALSPSSQDALGVRGLLHSRDQPGSPPAWRRSSSRSDNCFCSSAISFFLSSMAWRWAFMFLRVTFSRIAFCGFGS
jgi:hypothetical protein